MNFKKYILGILAILFLSVYSFAEKQVFLGEGKVLFSGPEDFVEHVSTGFEIDISTNGVRALSKYGLSQVRYFTGSTYDVVHDFGSIPVENGTSYVLQEVKMVKYGNEVGMVVNGVGNNLDELLATVKNSCNADELAELAQDVTSFNLAKTQPQQFINGKNFERGIGNLIDNGDQAFLNQVVNHANVNLAQYTPIKQLQINLPNGGYMIADNAWVKQINVGGQVQFEVILNECKLSSAAPWTTRQTELLNSLNGGNITFTSRSVKAEIANVIPQNSTIKIKTVVKTEGTGSGHTVTKVY